MKYVDGLINPKKYHKPLPKRGSWPTRSLKFGMVILTACVLTFYAASPVVGSLARQVEIFQLLTNGRYLVLFQNDAEIRASGGFIGSFAIIESNDGAIKPLYFESNIYKLDDPFNALVKIVPPKPLNEAIGERGWGLRDSNFAADFREAAPTILWFFEEETKRLTGPKKAEMDQALGGNYSLDGTVATTLSAFLDLLNATGPIALSAHNITVSKDNFFPIIEQAVAKDYFSSEKNLVINEPKTILKDLFPIALTRAQSLAKATQYRLAKQLLAEKKIMIYAKNSEKEETLVEQGWAGALQSPLSLAGNRKNQSSDFLAIVRSAHGGNKSSLDINPIYRYSVEPGADELRANLEITFEHTGSGEWPSGVNREYVRVIVPNGAKFVRAMNLNDDVTDRLDMGKEAGRPTFGFWLHTQPKTSQTIILTYSLPKEIGTNYKLDIFRQPGGNAPDVSLSYNKTILFKGRLLTDKIVTN